MKPELFSANTYPTSYIEKLVFAKSIDADDIKLACRQARSARLAVAGWTFFEIFRHGEAGRTDEYVIDAVTTCFSGDTGLPVGVAVAFTAWGDYNAGCFVRACHRRMRIGSRLVTELLAGESRPVRIHHGVEGSMNFWNVNGANELGYIKESSAPKTVPLNKAA